jgi:hypothetical protein
MGSKQRGLVLIASFTTFIQALTVYAACAAQNQLLTGLGNVLTTVFTFL